MIVCLCNGVTEQQITRAVEAGAQTVLEVAMATRAGTDCGSCIPTLHRCVQLAVQRTAEGSRSSQGCAAPVEAPVEAPGRGAQRAASPAD